MNQEFLEFLYEWRVKNNYKIAKFWVGPFDTTIDIFNPSYINKQLLKCKFRCTERFKVITLHNYIIDIGPKAENVYRMLEPWLGAFF